MSNRMLTPKDIEALPKCKHHLFIKCTGEYKNCLWCQFMGLGASLYEENLARSQHHVEVLLRILEGMGLMKDE